jgi:hypothetical protein
MNRHLPRIALLVGALAVCGQAAAHGGGGGWHGAGPLLGAAVIGAVVGAAVSGGQDRTVHVERETVYAPQPVYVQASQPVYVQAPPPVYVQALPQPVYYQPYPAVRGYAPPPPPVYQRNDGPPPGYHGSPRW